MVGIVQYSPELQGHRGNSIPFWSEKPDENSKSRLTCQVFSTFASKKLLSTTLLHGIVVGIIIIIIRWLRSFYSPDRFHRRVIFRSRLGN